MGGEKRKNLPSRSRPKGSPPRGRGKAQFGNCPYCHERITPAWAGKRKSTESVKSCKKDHPRVGGEKRLDAGHRNHTQGSPPRGRGKGGNLPGRVRPQGITPAWAGKSLRAGSTARPKGGSPPRGRGKGLRWSGYAQNHGITPALAGKSGSLCPQDRSRGDHPRVGGEKQRMPVRTDKRMGSPPRWRGKAIMPGTWSSSYGITPALAGKRLKRSHRSGIFISGPIPFHSVLHRPAGSGGSRAGRDGSPAGQPQNAGPA